MNVRWDYQLHVGSVHLLRLLSSDGRLQRNQVFSPYSIGLKRHLAPAFFATRLCSNHGQPGSIEEWVVVLGLSGE